MSKQNLQMTAGLCSLQLITSACTTTVRGGSPVEESYGDAVRSNVNAQLYDPAAAANPSTEAVEGTDGQRMEAVMEKHRGQTGSADNVSSPIVINVGQ
jgi:type IV pilus biogenesis protein CpaD/CtpE